MVSRSFYWMIVGLAAEWILADFVLFRTFPWQFLAVAIFGPRLLAVGRTRMIGVVAQVLGAVMIDLLLVRSMEVGLALGVNFTSFNIIFGLMMWESYRAAPTPVAPPQPEPDQGG